jgi:hypothetical protein
MIGKESFKPFENKVLWRILGLEGQEVTGGWSKLHDELHNLYSSSNITLGWK